MIMILKLIERAKSKNLDRDVEMYLLLECITSLYFFSVCKV
jgi:hypothetical protein